MITGFGATSGLVGLAISGGELTERVEFWAAVASTVPIRIGWLAIHVKYTTHEAGHCYGFTELKETTSELSTNFEKKCCSFTKIL